MKLIFEKWNTFAPEKENIKCMKLKNTFNETSAKTIKSNILNFCERWRKRETDIWEKEEEIDIKWEIQI